MAEHWWVVVDAAAGAAADVAYAGQPFGLESAAVAEMGGLVRYWFEVTSVRSARRFLEALRCAPWVVSATLEPRDR